MSTRESGTERKNREARRATFDSAAELYDQRRSGYPTDLIEQMFRTAGLSAGCRVLEIGCGTGQLTRQLLDQEVGITAIDLSPSMIEIAKRHFSVGGPELLVSTFEDFESPDGSFDLVVSATAFHWIDPQVRWEKTARLLGSGGWLALLSTGEEYDDPVGSKLRDLYIQNTVGPATWAEKPTEEEKVRQETSSDICERWFGTPSPSPELFGAAVGAEHSARRTVRTEFVIDLELTRATTLTYESAKRDSFVEDLREILASSPDVSLTQVARLVMAPLRASADWSS